MTEREIFAKAILCASRAVRDAFLDEACGNESSLRERLERLLKSHESTDCLLDRNPAELLNALSEVVADHDPEADREETAKQLASFLEPATRSDALGRLGNYEVLQVLGRGGFGIVVKAHDDSLARLVAIKILSPHLAATSTPRKRFLREARAAAAIQHENVVRIYTVQEQPLPYLVMEFIEGQTLQERIDDDGPLEAAEVVWLGRQIAMGLAAAHSEGLIHRDIKPANILLEAGVEPRVKLTDFGLARTSDDASLTHSRVIAGSPLYMAPEQVAGAPLDHRTDLFCFGSVLYTMLTGRPPFRAANTFAILKRVAEETPSPIREVIPEVPAGLCAVIERLHEKDPAQRFETAADVAQALAASLTDSVPMPATVARHLRLTPGKVVALLILLVTAVGLAGHFLGPAQHDMSSLPPVDDEKPDSRPGVNPAKASGFVVTSLLDDDREGTLRWAVDQANLHHGEDTITFDPTVFGTPQTITLAQGPLTLTDPAQTSIHGPDAGVMISGDDKFQVFVVGARFEVEESAARAFFSRLTITHGSANDEVKLGGGVLCRGGATLTLTGCTLRDNQAVNTDGGGGGVFCGDSTIILTNCTLIRNKAFEGGAVKNFAGSAELTNCTLVDNSVERTGAGIWTGGWDRARTVAYNCLFANSGGPDVFQIDAIEVAGDYNLSRDNTAPGPHSLLNAEPRVGLLGHNRGPTETIPLLTGSPALDAGNNDHLPAGLTTDQRGLPRIGHGKVDIGAFEVQ